MVWELGTAKGGAFVILISVLKLLDIGLDNLSSDNLLMDVFCALMPSHQLPMNIHVI